jgi:hypothetical protein
MEVKYLVRTKVLPHMVNRLTVSSVSFTVPLCTVCRWGISVRGIQDAFQVYQELFWPQTCRVGKVSVVLPYYGQGRDFHQHRAFNSRSSLCISPGTLLSTTHDRRVMQSTICEPYSLLSLLSSGTPTLNGRGHDWPVRPFRPRMEV